VKTSALPICSGGQGDIEPGQTQPQAAKAILAIVVAQAGHLPTARFQGGDDAWFGPKAPVEDLAGDRSAGNGRGAIIRAIASVIGATARPTGIDGWTRVLGWWRGLGHSPKVPTQQSYRYNRKST